MERLLDNTGFASDLLLRKCIQNLGDDLLVCSAFLADFFDNYAIYGDTCPENQIRRANTQSIADGEERQKTRSGFPVLDV